MKRHILTTLLALTCVAVLEGAYADCAGPNLADKKRNYQRAQAYEKEGNQEHALRAYAAAQGYACEPHNPYEADAAKRAAALGLPLGKAAEQSGAFRRAFELYEAGGHFAAADRALMALTRSQPDDPAAFTQARQVLEFRALPAFQSNNKAALAATGAYRPDPAHLAEVLTMPEKGAQRALQKEASAFDEQYLREYVQIIQSRPDDPTDFAAWQSSAPAQEAFARTWSHDPLKLSRTALSLVNSWAAVTPDESLRSKLDTQRRERLEQRAATLLRYDGVPALLESAMDYYRSAGSDEAVAKVKARAAKLGDEASAKKRYLLATEYYDAADQDAKAQAARDTQQKLAMSKMQPTIDDARRQAERMQKEFSDPAKAQAMREQAEAMRKSLQEQQQSNAKRNAQRADDLESELGL